MSTENGATVAMKAALAKQSEKKEESCSISPRYGRLRVLAPTTLVREQAEKTR